MGTRTYNWKRRKGRKISSLKEAPSLPSRPPCPLAFRIVNNKRVVEGLEVRWGEAARQQGLWKGCELMIIHFLPSVLPSVPSFFLAWTDSLHQHLRWYLRTRLFKFSAKIINYYYSEVFRPSTVMISTPIRTPQMRKLYDTIFWWCCGRVKTRSWDEGAAREGGIPVHCIRGVSSEGSSLS